SAGCSAAAPAEPRAAGPVACHATTPRYGPHRRREATMGFLDKAMSQVQQAAKQGQDKLDDLQAKKAADGLLRDLGAWYYASETGRDHGQGPGEIARILGELQAHEAEHGPLGGGTDDQVGIAPSEAAPPPPPPAAPAPQPPAPPAPQAPTAQAP